MKIDREKLTEIIVAWVFIAGALMLSVPSLVYVGWVLHLMWGWFIAAMGLPVLDTPTCIGIWLICKSFIVHQPNSKSDPNEKLKDLAVRAMIAALNPLVTSTAALVTGFIIHHWFMVAK